MIVLIWNCRGMDNLRAVSSLKDLVRNNKPDIIILFETLVHVNKVEDLKRRLGFDFCFAVDREGRSGGVAVLWNREVECNILNYSLHYINLEVVDHLKGN